MLEWMGSSSRLVVDIIWPRTGLTCNGVAVWPRKSYLASLCLISNTRLSRSYLLSSHFVLFLLFIKSNPRSMHYWMHWPWRSCNFFKQTILKIKYFKRVATNNVWLTLKWMINLVLPEILLQRTLAFIFTYYLCFGHSPSAPPVACPSIARFGKQPGGRQF